MGDAVNGHPAAAAVSEGDLADIGLAIGRSTSAAPVPIPIAGLVDLEPLKTLSPDAPASEFESALLAIREALPANVDALTLATLRETLRREVPKLPARMLNAALAAKPRTKERAPEKQLAAVGSEVKLRDDEPWPAAVALGALLDDTAAAVRRYVVVSQDQASAIALWVGISYLIDVLSIAPILLVTSATMRAGKTTLCTVLGSLTPRSILLSSLTPAVIFRLIEKHHPTLVADEADSWLNDEKSELRGIICAGHTRATANIPRCVGDDHDVRLFSAWCPRVIAMIGRPPATIRDRSIPIELRRRKATEETVERLRVDRIEIELQRIRQQWRRWAADNQVAVREADPPVPGQLGDRAADCWRSLLAVADLAGDKWAALGRKAAIGLSATDTDESLPLELLADIRSIFDKDEAVWLESGVLVSGLVAMTDRPWPEFRRGHPLTPHSLARLLRPFDILPTQRRSGAVVHRGYDRATFMDAWSRYLPSDRYSATSEAESEPPEPQSEAL